jgi:hypothetical protein
MASPRKITVEVPRDLLRRAQESSRSGVTVTVRKGLELVAAGKAYAELRKLRGQVRLSIDVSSLREDRS